MEQKSWSALAAEIELCVRKYPSFAAMAGVVAAVLEAEGEFSGTPESDAGGGARAFSSEEMQERMKKDESLGLDNLEIELTVLQALLADLTRAVAAADGYLGKAAEELRIQLDVRWPRGGVSASVEEIRQVWEQAAQDKSVAVDLATFLFAVTLASLYRRKLDPLASALDTSAWRRGDCPVCEARPHFGLLRSEDGAKILECWLCGTRWQHTRLQCPFCGNREADSLGFFTVEQDKSCRLHFCEKCHSYYKLFDPRGQAEEDVTLLVQHLATLSHDYLALKEGFNPGSGLQWVDFAGAGDTRTHN